MKTMLTIGQLASYTGVTVRTVRHYHKIGLLPEPERQHNGYRSYDAAAVVLLIRIRTLAEAGVPLARVQELLDANDASFTAAVAAIDHRLRAEIRTLQEHRHRIARLAAGDHLALPAEVVAYLDELRARGVSLQMIEGERDAWILIAARWPDRIPQFMVDKMAQLDDPRTMRLYRLLAELAETGIDDGRLTMAADLIIEMHEEMARYGELDRQNEQLNDDPLIALLDSFAADSHPVVERLQEMMVKRGWTGWSRLERTTKHTNGGPTHE